MNCWDFSGLKWAVSGKVDRRAGERFKFNALSISGCGAEPAVARSPLGAIYHGSDATAVTDSWVLGVKSVRFNFRIRQFFPRSGIRSGFFRAVFVSGDFRVVFWLPCCLQCCRAPVRVLFRSSPELFLPKSISPVTLPSV